MVVRARVRGKARVERWTAQPAARTMSREWLRLYGPFLVSAGFLNHCKVKIP